MAKGQTVGTSRREEYAEATRRAILEAARQLFSERGYFATKVDDKQRREQLEALSAELARERSVLDERQRLLETRQEQLQRELANRLAQCQERERKVIADRAAFDKAQAEFQSDLVRLHRLQ